MENALLIGLSRQMALGRELDVIANNMANVTTNGFKARSSRFQRIPDAERQRRGLPAADRRLSYVIDAGTPLDLRQGAIERTGNPLDVAIRGDAFFAVQTPAGERYTRNGAFEINAAGPARHQRRPCWCSARAGRSPSARRRPASASRADGTVSTEPGRARQAPAGALRQSAGAHATRATTCSLERAPAQPAGTARPRSSPARSSART